MDIYGDEHFVGLDTSQQTTRSNIYSVNSVNLFRSVTTQTGI